MEYSLSSGWPKAVTWKRVKGKEADIVVGDSLLPPEIITEILSWFPIQFHGRLMLVCRQWYALVQDRHFMEKHMDRDHTKFRQYVIYYTSTPKVLGDFLSDSDGENYMLENYEDVYACDGLYLQRSIVTNKYRIRNPLTKQVLELPDPHKGTHAIVFSYVPCTRNYKFVSIYDDERGTECCEVFDVGTDDLSWRLLKMPAGYHLNRNRKNLFVVLTGDAVHCVRVIASGPVMLEEIVSLNLETEQFTVTNLPSGQYKSWESVWPLNFRGKLALVDRMEAGLCLLVLEDYKKQRWGKRKPLIPSASLKILEDKHGTVFPYSFDLSERLLQLWVKDVMFISYNIKTLKEEQIFCLDSGQKVLKEMHPLLHSLVRVKGMQPEEKVATQPTPLKGMQLEEKTPAQPPPLSAGEGHGST